MSREVRRFKRYPAYKWFSELPEHWSIKRFKSVASERLSNLDKKTEEGQKPEAELGVLSGKPTEQAERPSRAPESVKLIFQIWPQLYGETRECMESIRQWYKANRGKLPAFE